jgi:hypothetical protein
MTGGPVLNARVSNGRAQFYFIGIPGRTYQVQVSDSLAPANWRGLGLVNATGEGLVQFTDPSAGGLSYRFYRAVQP